jgi:hemoglobin
MRAPLVIMLIATSLAGCGEAPPDRASEASAPSITAPVPETAQAPSAVATPVAAAPAADALVGVGGRAGLERLVERFYTELLGDPVTAEYFELADAVPLKARLVEQFCELLGGPCTYSGRSMRGSHWGMRLEMRHFDATIAALERAMEAESVAPEARRALLAKLAPMYTDIVEFRSADERPAVERTLAVPPAP